MKPINAEIKSAIIEMYKEGNNQKTIADRYGVHYTTVSRILKREGLNDGTRSRTNMKTDEPTGIICLKCGHRHPDNFTFCPDCGSRMILDKDSAIEVLNKVITGMNTPTAYMKNDAVMKLARVIDFIKTIE